MLASGELVTSSERSLLDGGSGPAVGAGMPARRRRLGHLLALDSRAGGAPRVRPLLIVWVGGRPYFASGDRTRKSRALAEDGRCSLAVDTDLLHIVIEGTATPVDDPDLLQRVADAYRATHG